MLADLREQNAKEAAEVLSDELTGPRGAGYRRMIELRSAGRAGTPDEVATVGALLMGSDGASSLAAISPWMAEALPRTVSATSRRSERAESPGWLRPGESSLLLLQTGKSERPSAPAVLHIERPRWPRAVEEKGACVMNPIGKRTVLLANVGVWIAAITSATAVAYATTRPASLPALGSAPASEAATEWRRAALPVSVSQPTIYMPDDTIVGARPLSEAP